MPGTNITTFGITPSKVMRYVNPSLDPSGTQIGNLFSLVDIVMVKTGAQTIVLDLSVLGQVGVNQIEGYRLFVNGEFAAPFSIVSNSESDIDGNVMINVDGALPVDGTWQILCRTTRVDFQDADISSEILAASTRIRAALKAEYGKLLYLVSGLLLWPKDLGGFNTDTSPLSAIQLPFFEARNLRVWLNPVWDYALRTLTSGTDITNKFTLTNNSGAHTSILSVIGDYVPSQNENIALDFQHDLDPVPETLKHAVLEIIKARLSIRNGSNVTQAQREFAESCIARAIADVENIPEFDELDLYRETKAQTMRGHRSVRIFRG